ncbi:hypothetical protein [Streptomyces hokutonensis]|uniref:hypothetical protein n=1 Tax=Streptomyces hokutonensis TaxID=1306990 RepID=UPI000367F64B|nr:hypothetical protein [Streptomyces hokutonensis]
MPVTKHSVSVWPARGGRKYQYRCSCGARGYETDSSSRAQQMGDDHKDKASRKGGR